MNTAAGREPRKAGFSFSLKCATIPLVESTSILRKLASIDFVGAVKFVFDKGKLSQVVESQAVAGEGAIRLDDVNAAGQLLRIARQVELTGYIVVYFTPQDIRATYVRTQTAGSFDDTMTFERAFAMRSHEVVA